MSCCELAYNISAYRQLKHAVQNIRARYPVRALNLYLLAWPAAETPPRICP